MERIKDNFENGCIQTCSNIKTELERLPKLSHIRMDNEDIAIIGLYIPYVREEMYKDRMSAYIDETIVAAESFKEQEAGCTNVSTNIYVKKSSTNTLGGEDTSGYTTADAQYAITDEKLSKLCTLHSTAAPVTPSTTTNNNSNNNSNNSQSTTTKQNTTPQNTTATTTTQNASNSQSTTAKQNTTASTTGSSN